MAHGESLRLRAIQPHDRYPSARPATSMQHPTQPGVYVAARQFTKAQAKQNRCSRRHILRALRKRARAQRAAG